MPGRWRPSFRLDRLHTFSNCALSSELSSIWLCYVSTGRRIRWVLCTIFELSAKIEIKLHFMLHSLKSLSNGYGGSTSSSSIIPHSK